MAHLRCEPASERRGGAHNRADRTSYALSHRQAKDLVAATSFATSIGLSLNTFTTVHFGMLGVPDCLGAKATRQFCKLANDWIKKRGHPTAFAWVREHGPGKGNHLHLLWHLPPGVRLGALPRRWASRIAKRWGGGVYRPGAVKTLRVGGSANLASIAPARLHLNIAGTLEYMLKGADRSTALRLGLPRPADGGIVVGKRAGTSESIASKARLAAGWLR